MLALFTLGAALAGDLDDARALFAWWVRDPNEVEQLVGHLDTATRFESNEITALGNTDGLRDALVRNVIANLTEKKRLSETGASMALSPADIQRKVIDFEAFKLETYITSGVFPKRYFGYVDGRGETAPDEARLRTTVSKAVDVTNAWQAEHGDPLRVTAAEVAVTFLAESGALTMLGPSAGLDRLHPVFDVGLDNVASGFAELGDLQERLDEALGTHMNTLVAWVEPNADVLPVPTVVPNYERWLMPPQENAGRQPYLVRYMTFEEAIAGTALMWVWEKRIAARKVETMGARPLSERPADEQFIIGSLVYNSGNVHGPERWEQIRSFSTGKWLWETSEKNAARRPRLPVLLPAVALANIRDGGAYAVQPTSWLAVYHILQRYGAWVALHRFSDTFAADDSFLPPVPARPEWLPETASAKGDDRPEVPEATASPACGCGKGPGSLAWLLVVGICDLFSRPLHRREWMHPTRRVT